MLIVNLFAVIHLCMLVNSKFALLKISLELIPEMNTLVSSAKEILELNCKQLLKSFIYKINNNIYPSLLKFIVLIQYRV